MSVVLFPPVFQKEQSGKISELTMEQAVHTISESDDILKMNILANTLLNDCSIIKDGITLSTNRELLEV
jgi:hypothetical protein